MNDEDIIVSDELNNKLTYFVNSVGFNKTLNLSKYYITIAKEFNLQFDSYKSKFVKEYNYCLSYSYYDDEDCYNTSAISIERKSYKYFFDYEKIFGCWEDGVDVIVVDLICKYVDVLKLKEELPINNIKQDKRIKI